MSKLFTLPREVLLSNSGALIPGAKAYFYEAGTATPLSVYTEYTLTTPHSNPVVADGDGRFAAIYYDPAQDYKVVLKNASDVEIYTQDYAASALSTAEVGSALYPRTTAEISAGVTPTNYQYEPGNVLRYGTNTTPGTTDMIAAIQAAVDSIEQDGGGTVFLPPGTYLISTSIVFPDDWPITIDGSGLDSTVITYSGASDAITMVGTVSNPVIKSAIKNLRITTSTGGTGIRCTYGYSIEFHNLRVNGFTSGIRIEQTWKCLLSHCTLDANTDGLLLSDEANNITLIGTELLNNTNGLYAVGTRALSVYGSTLEANSAYGAYITSDTSGTSQNVLLSGCYIEGNGTNEVRVTKESGSSPQNIVIDGCYFVCLTTKASVPIYVAWADNITVDNSFFSVGTATYDYSLYLADSATISNAVFGYNRDSTTNGIYKGTSTSYRNKPLHDARAWGRFTVSGAAIASSNLYACSVAYISTGVYEVTLDTAMPGTNYNAVATAENGASYTALLCSTGQPTSTTVFRIYTASDSATAAEARTVNFAVFAQ